MMLATCIFSFGENNVVVIIFVTVLRVPLGYSIAIIVSILHLQRYNFISNNARKLMRNIISLTLIKYYL
nr:MAG TPA_asm: hypothetical protein [Caudoviricetes sp.]